MQAERDELRERMRFFTSQSSVDIDEMERALVYVRYVRSNRHVTSRPKSSRHVLSHIAT
jgi:hypothetical protein